MLALTRRSRRPLWSVRCCPFWLSIACSVARPGRARRAARAARLDVPLSRLRSRRLGGGAAGLGARVRVRRARRPNSASAQGLTYLALVAVPLLAALALGWRSARRARPARALLVPAAVRARLGRPRRARRGGGGARALGSQLRRARRAARRGHAAALAGRGDRRDGAGGHARWSSPTCCSAPTTPSTPPIRRRGCRGCRARCSARR